MAGQKKPRDNKYNRPQRTGQNNSAKNNSAFQKGVQGGQNDMQSALQYQPTPEDIKPMMAGDQQQGQPPIQKNIAPVPAVQKGHKPIGQEQVRKAMEILKKYKKGKQNLEDKITRNEKWWKMRHWELMQTEETQDDPKPASGWLFNTIISKHADYMDSIPTSNILPREEGDVEEAQRLSSIVPVVMEQNGYKSVYSEEAWYKLKHGTGVYGIFWDSSKLNGLGDVAINCVDLLTLFWEPGVKDIQKSKNFFSVELVDNETLEEQYPQLKDNLSKTQDTLVKKYMYDESIDTTGKCAVVDWYYHKMVNGKKTLQYCKFVDDIVLYATENDTEIPMQQVAQPVTDEMGNPVLDEMGAPVIEMVEVPTGEASMAERGLYDHGKYPFVFDVLFPEAGMPVGLGFVDICKNAQASIDIYNNAFEKNVQFVASPRYLARNDGGLNEDEFNNPNALIVHTDGNLGEDSLAPINTPAFINSNYINILDQKITEMKETAGNRDATTGGTQAGVTAASAIAAIQESAGKTSRDQISTSYEAHKQVVDLVIELIRQFYTMPRQFRITGAHGKQEFTQYSNAGLQAQHQGTEYGVDMGYRLPVFDIEVKAEKESAYTQLSQNELAIQFYNQGFFNPQYCDQALACIEMMEFHGKQMVVERIQQNGGMYKQMAQLMIQMQQMAEIIDQLSGGQTQMAGSVADMIGEKLGIAQTSGAQAKLPEVSMGESTITANARERANNATSPR